MVTVPINNRFTRFLGIKTPIICAPMAGAGGGALAAQVSLGGGFGFMASVSDPIRFQSEVSLARSNLSIPEDSCLPIGVSFQCWQLEQRVFSIEPLLPIIFRNNMQAVWLSFGNDIGRWVNLIRENDPRAGTKNAIVIFVLVSSVEEAIRATKDWKADVIVAQGIEAGGHGSKHAPPVSTLLSQILAITNIDGPHVVGAGGLATGAHVASLLTLGAAGVALGTRFLLSPESLYSDLQRQALLAAPSSLAVRTMAFDVARNTLGWPEGIDGRGLRNETVDDYERSENVDVLRSRFEEGLRTSDTNRIIVWAGSGVGVMNSILPAIEIVKELHQDCLDRLQAASQLINTTKQ